MLSAKQAEAIPVNSKAQKLINMATIPSENAFSALFGLLREGFGFIGNRRKKYNSDIFQIALPGLKVICFGGEDAARNFYDPEYFVRKGAVPPPVQKTLTGENAIHTTDGAVHQNRKAMFMALMTPENIKRLTDLIGTELDRSLSNWENQDWIVLFNEAQQFLCKAVCAWAGVPIKDSELQSKAADFISIVDAFGAVGPRNWNGRMARGRIEQWLMGVIADVRENRLAAQPGTALFAAATHRNTLGNLFDLQMAAVELMNIIRPTIAISWYIVFGAKALYDYPAFREDFLRNEGGKYRDWFIDEIRRFYPFAPFMGARVKKPFAWHGYTFPAKALVLLDMYGTNHDESLWDHPDVFEPERFKNRTIKPFDFLAQGGGDPNLGHRCPGEWITIETLKTVLGFLVEKVDFDVPKQDLRYKLSRLPTLPKSGFVMGNVRRKVR